jgi:thiol-disulfide isomerase/thioredoxin
MIGFVLLLMAFLASASVVELHDNTFDHALAENDFTLVMFHAPWCGACREAKPMFIEAEQKLSKKTPAV